MASVTLYIIRRIFNYLILTAVAASLAYMLASTGLNPVWELENRHPRPPQSSIDQLLDAWGVNPSVPLIERTWTWFINIFHGDLGLTVANQPVTQQIAIRAGVSLQLAAGRGHPGRDPRRDPGRVGRGAPVQVQRPGRHHAVLHRVRHPGVRHGHPVHDHGDLPEPGAGGAS
ncbi:hypothetical protein [Microbacterium elymi]|uniref:hypothetical protein n=1 Tax=Microbacterium elymi TaxID=2909587 RepID=UPI003390749D